MHRNTAKDTALSSRTISDTTPTLEWVLSYNVLNNLVFVIFLAPAHPLSCYKTCMGLCTLSLPKRKDPHPHNSYCWHVPFPAQHPSPMPCYLVGYQCSTATHGCLDSTRDDVKMQCKVTTPYNPYRFYPSVEYTPLPKKCMEICNEPRVGTTP